MSDIVPIPIPVEKESKKEKKPKEDVVYFFSIELWVKGILIGLIILPILPIADQMAHGASFEDAVIEFWNFIKSFIK